MTLFNDKGTANGTNGVAAAWADMRAGAIAAPRSSGNLPATSVVIPDKFVVYSDSNSGVSRTEISGTNCQAVIFKDIGLGESEISQAAARWSGVELRTLKGTLRLDIAVDDRGTSAYNPYYKFSVGEQPLDGLAYGNVAAQVAELVLGLQVYRASDGHLPESVVSLIRSAICGDSEPKMGILNIR